MHVGIGIDTGGTYTDAVIFDSDTREILASGKTRTTKEDLRECVLGAIDLLPHDLCAQASVVALSTTLATNACVEGKGARAKLILMGVPPHTLGALRIKENYGVDPKDVLCLATKSSFDGKHIDDPDWQQVLEDNAAWFADAQAIAISEMNALRNGALMERVGVSFLERELDIPILAATDVAHELNMIERGATALLNARLMPVVGEFITAVRAALEERGITGTPMIVRSDGSFMNAEQAHSYAVETIVSGPAASVQGCKELADCSDYMVVDMGGTTTDVSLVAYGEPIMTTGTRIGQWRTQVEGVFVDTFGLGGDSAVKRGSEGIELTTRRVEPLCVAAARWPWIVDELKKLLKPNYLCVQSPVYEVLYLVREPRSMDNYSETERGLIELLRKGPMITGLQEFTEIFRLDGNHITKRLEGEGIVMRAGFTPTDAMHIKGDFTSFDTSASLIVAEYLSKAMPLYSSADDPIMALCDDVYDAVEQKLYANLVRVLWQSKMPDSLKDVYPESVDALLKDSWNRHKSGKEDPLALMLLTPAKLVGVGAPIGIFLPQVAEALRTECVIPKHAEVANAVGAIATRVRVQVRIVISAYYHNAEFIGFNVPCEEGVRTFKTIEEAVEFTRGIAIEQARNEAYSRGARGELDCSFETDDQVGVSFGVRIHFSTTCTATAIERQGSASSIEKDED